MLCITQASLAIAQEPIKKEYQLQLQLYIITNFLLEHRLTSVEEALLLCLVVHRIVISHSLVQMWSATGPALGSATFLNVSLLVRSSAR